MATAAADTSRWQLVLRRPDAPDELVAEGTVVAEFAAEWAKFLATPCNEPGCQIHAARCTARRQNGQRCVLRSGHLNSHLTLPKETPA